MKRIIMSLLAISALALTMMLPPAPAKAESFIPMTCTTLSQNIADSGDDISQIRADLFRYAAMQCDPDTLAAALDNGTSRQDICIGMAELKSFLFAGEPVPEITPERLILSEEEEIHLMFIGALQALRCSDFDIQ